MKLLIVSDAWEPQINGVVRVYQNLAREWRAKGHHVEIIGPDRFFSVPMPGYPEIRLSLFAKRKLWRLMDEAEADSIHIAVEGPLGWLARRWCLRRQKPFSSFYHTQFPDYVAARAAFLGRKAADGIRALCIRHVKRFHAPARHTYVTTKSIEEQLRGWGWKTAIRRIACGVDFATFHTGPKTLFADLPRPVHLFVGRIAIEKNISAFLDLPLAGSKVVVGHGPQLEALKAVYPEAVFTGAKTGTVLADHFRSADVFVFPSKTDTFGLVIAEALACGLPVAGYNVAGPRDIITEPALGAVDDDLGAAVARALAAPATPEARYAHAKALYSWPQIADAFVEGETSTLP